MTGVITVSVCGLVLFVLLIIILKSRARFNEIDERYGKPYKAKLVKMIGGHPALKRGSMAITFHPKDAIVFNRKVFLFSQISSIKIISQLPSELVQLKLNIETSVGGSTSTEAEYGVPLPLVEVGVSRLDKLNNRRKKAVNSGVEEQYLCIAVTDEYGEHEIIFTAKSEFEEIANHLLQKWNMYNLC